MDTSLLPGGWRRLAIDGKLGHIAEYSAGEVVVYRRDAGGNYAQSARRELKGSEAIPVRLAIGGGKVVLGREDGHILVMDARSLDILSDPQPEKRTAIHSVAASPDGSWFAILFANRKLYLVDARSAGGKSEKLQPQRAKLWSQGDFSTATFDSEGNLLVVDRVARVSRMQLPDLQVTQTKQPRQLPYLDETYDFWGLNLNYYMLHRFFVTPVYTLLPPVGELGWFFQTILTGEKTAVSWFSLSAEEPQRLQRNPWSAVWQCGLFVAVLLGVGCWIIQRAEF